MKLAFTTLGCPSWNLERIIQQARQMGFDGIDFRGLGSELAVYRLPEFSSQARETARRIADAGLEVSCFSSSARAFNATPQRSQASLDEMRAYAPLCAAFGARYIRVFGGSLDGADPERAVEQAAADLRRMSAAAAEHGARLLIETHDDWIASALLRQLMLAVGSQVCGVLWDVHHPYRMAGEAPALTWQNLGEWVEYTHWKDSRAEPGDPTKYTYTHFGQGDLPLPEFVRLLQQGGYAGWLTLEWEKRWHPDLPEPEDAFPLFVKRMRSLLG